MLAPPALCAAALAWLRPERASWGFAALLPCIWIAAALLSRLGGPSAARALLVLSGFGVLLWPEMALRLSSFRFEHAGVIQFGYPRPEKLILAPVPVAPVPQVSSELAKGFLRAHGIRGERVVLSSTAAPYARPKGIHDLIEAARDLPGVAFVVIGGTTRAVERLRRERGGGGTGAEVRGRTTGGRAQFVEGAAVGRGQARTWCRRDRSEPATSAGRLAREAVQRSAG